VKGAKAEIEFKIPHAGHSSRLSDIWLAGQASRTLYRTHRLAWKPGMLPVTDTISLPLTMSSVFLNFH